MENIDNSTEIKALESKVFALMKAIENLAPHPDKPDYKGPLFVQADSAYKPAAEYDGALGSMLMEGVLGTSFLSAAGNIDWGNIAEGISEFIKDRSSSQPANCSPRLGQRNVISNRFNAACERKVLMAAFQADLPKRLGMERWLAYYTRKIYALRKHAPVMAGPRMAA